MWFDPASAPIVTSYGSTTNLQFFLFARNFFLFLYISCFDCRGVLSPMTFEGIDYLCKKYVGHLWGVRPVGRE
jgi:hypothetical protein